MSDEWSQRRIADRVAWVARWRRAVASHESELTALMETEVGKPRFEGVMSDLLPFLEACTWLERRAERLLGPRTLGGTPFWLAGTRLTESRVPLGEVAIIATWNYPIQLVGVQVAQALVAGNRVVVKPSERSPRTQARLLELAVSAGLPEGVLTWTPPTREEGARLLASRRFDHVVFTGSTEVGTEIARTLAPTLTPTTLELSGRDSVLVLEDADAKRAACCVWNALIMNAGQTCMGPRRALVHERAYEVFERELALLASQSEPNKRLIDAGSAERCRMLVMEALGAGGRAIPETPRLGDDPREFQACVVLECPVECGLFEGRHFGPVLAVRRVASTEEALALHELGKQRLATGIFTRDVHAARRLVPRLRSTMVTINDLILPTAHPGASLGGIGESGIGISRGAEGLLAMTRPQYVSVGKGGVRRASSRPPAKFTGLVIRALMRWYGGRSSRVPARAEHEEPQARSKETSGISQALGTPRTQQ